ncbi:acyltransferase family protein [Pontibacter beigongshangensis]|uniref:acyltransferase family protein n=1 Tax=Pontibacter beigongshangensis TaxID=2574733 RepID=UPI001650B1CC|nr:acyltransferase family protein [Pontibacter beigongshangensis]
MSFASSLEARAIASKKVRYQQIDVLKGLAIVSVLLLHALSYEMLLQAYAIFHIWQAVPLFMILMGLNLGLSPAGSKTPLLRIYLSQGFRKKVGRIVVPVLVMYVVSLLAGFVWYQVTGQYLIAFSWLNAIGLLPVTGRGNYFVTLVLQSLLLLPLIGYLFQRRPWLTVILLVLLEVLFLLWANQFSFSEEQAYLYSAAFPRYFSAVAFGLALSCAVPQPASFRNVLLLLLLAIASGSFLYQISYDISDFKLVREEWQSQCVLAFGYAALLVLVLFRLLPNHSDNKLLGLVAALGKASYHIFLIQVLYFGLAGQDYPVVQALAVCLPAGYLFYLLERKYTGRNSPLV